jgi:hypothetical protein
MRVAPPGRPWGPRSTRAFRHSSGYFRAGHVSLVSPGLGFFINPQYETARAAPNFQRWPGAARPLGKEEGPLALAPDSSSRGRTYPG